MVRTKQIKTMRTREEIEKDKDGKGYANIEDFISLHTELTLEVLLDIRELLTKK